MTRTLTTLVAAILFTQGLAFAQGSQRTPTDLGPTSFVRDWPTDRPFHPPTGKLYVLTTANPTHRRACRVQSFTPDQLICARHGHKPTIYPSQDILALISPAHRSTVKPWLFGTAVTGAGTIAGAIFLASISIPAAIPAAIVGAAILVATPLVTYVFAHDNTPETLLYLQPGQHLAVTLR